VKDDGHVKIRVTVKRHTSAYVLAGEKQA